MITFIVPVYNAENTIAMCLDSITNQMTLDYEVICVDDGSVDRSSYIIKSYSRYNPRIKYIGIDNSGPSVARNLGLSNAQGEWVIFVDSDDYYMEDSLHYMEEYITKNENVDLIVFGYYEKIEINTFKNRSLCSQNKIIGIKEYIAKVGQPSSMMYFNSLWNKVYKRSIIQKIEGFQENIRLGEDAIFNYEYYKHCKIIGMSEKMMYVYKNFDTNSLSRGNDSYQIDWNAYIEITFFMKRLFKYMGLDKEYKINYTSYILGAINSFIHNNNIIDKKEALNRFREIDQRYLYLYKINGKFNILILILLKIKWIKFTFLLCDIKRKAEVN